MALICDKCKKAVKVSKNYMESGLDLCEDCKVLFNDLMEKTVNTFTAQKGKKNLLGDIGNLFGTKK